MDIIVEKLENTFVPREVLSNVTMKKGNGTPLAPIVFGITSGNRITDITAPRGVYGVVNPIQKTVPFNNDDFESDIPNLVRMDGIKLAVLANNSLAKSDSEKQPSSNSPSNNFYWSSSTNQTIDPFKLKPVMSATVITVTQPTAEEKYNNAPVDVMDDVMMAKDFSITGAPMSMVIKLDVTETVKNIPNNGEPTEKENKYVEYLDNDSIDDFLLRKEYVNRTETVIGGEVEYLYSFQMSIKDSIAKVANDVEYSNPTYVGSGIPFDSEFTLMVMADIKFEYIANTGGSDPYTALKPVKEISTCVISCSVSFEASPIQYVNYTISMNDDLTIRGMGNGITINDNAPYYQYSSATTWIGYKDGQTCFHDGGRVRYIKTNNVSSVNDFTDYISKQFGVFPFNTIQLKPIGNAQEYIPQRLLEASDPSQTLPAPNKYYLDGFVSDEKSTLKVCSAGGAYTVIYNERKSMFGSVEADEPKRFFFVLRDGSGYYEFDLDVKGYVQGVLFDGDALLIHTTDGENVEQTITMFLVSLPYIRPKTITYDMSGSVFGFIPCQTERLAKGGIISKV